MKSNTKSNKLYSELRDAILFRHFQPGAMLERETELAESYNVSRNTLRTALGRLEKESLVRRVRGKGTYVSKGREIPKITFFLPCSNKLYSSMILSHILSALIGVTHQMDCQVETIALSSSNDPDDIDWSKLINLDANSKVVVVGFWFERIFQFLNNSGCRVVFIHDGTFQKENQSKYFNNWVNLEKDQFDIGYKMAEVLLSSDCANPVVFSRFIGRNLQPRIDGAIACLEKHGFAPEGRAIKLPLIEASLESRQQVYFQSQDKKQFDGFIMDDPILFQYISTQTPALKGGCFDYRQNTTGIIPESTFFSEFPLKQIGIDAMEELLKDEFKPFYRKYKGKIYDNNGKELVSSEQLKYDKVKLNDKKL